MRRSTEVTEETKAAEKAALGSLGDGYSAPRAKRRNARSTSISGLRCLQGYRVFSVMKSGFTTKKLSKNFDSAGRCLKAAFQFNTGRPGSYDKGSFK